MTHTTDSNQPDASERSPVTTAPKKKLIEVSLPLETINIEGAREKSIKHGHPSTLHLWWARRPLAAARAVLFAQLVDDPASRPAEFPTVAEQDRERARLHALIEKLVVWENANDAELLAEARDLIRESNGGVLPAVLDPFAGGGTIPFEAQRLGLQAHASDLNPVAVLINKALSEYPPKFKGKPPVHPEAERRMVQWHGVEGIAEDVRKYGEWMRDEAYQRIGHNFPVAISEEGTKHEVIAWIWARTVRSPNPANPVETPLARSWWLSKKKGGEARISPEVRDGEVRYTMLRGPAAYNDEAEGTVGRTGAVSVADGTPIDLKFIRAEGQAGRLGAHLTAVVAEGVRSRLYLSPSEAHQIAASIGRPEDVPEGELPKNPRDFKTPNYGMDTWADLFTNRQLLTLTTLSDLIDEVREKVLLDGIAAGEPEGTSLEEGGEGAAAYADAVATYLAFSISKVADRGSTITTWFIGRESTRNTFSRQAIPMTWDFVEVNPFASGTGSILGAVRWTAEAIQTSPFAEPARVQQSDAAQRSYGGMVVSTDPPYYDNINYSDLSDFFYVWLRRSLRNIQKKGVGTLLTPKADELVANPYRHASRDGAEKFFVDGFNQVFEKVRTNANPEVPLTVYYAYKQQDTDGGGAASTGWYTLLDGLIKAGWEITATWPLRSELSSRMLSSGTNALASSIVLACRPRAHDASATTRRSFIATLKSELPEALRTLMQGAIAPVDLAQAAIGPGIAVFSRFARVREADSSDMSVRDALMLINATLDEVLGEQESDFDPDTRFAVKWYRQYGWTQENSGIADQLARSSDTSISALERGGIFEAKGGKARLLPPAQLEGAWDAADDERVSVWEATVRLAAVMAKDGADKVAELLPSVQTRVNLDAVKELGFLLFHEADKKKDTKDAILFNGLVSAWGDVNEQARKYASTPRSSQQAFDFDEDEE